MTILGTIAYVLFMQAAATTPPAAKGTIEGTVSDARNGVPLQGVRVILSRAASTQPPPGAAPSLPTAAPPPPPPPPPPPAAAGANASAGVVSSTFVFQNVGPAVTAAGGNIPSATTDSQGRYVLKDVEAGFYRVTFAQNSYVKQDYGQRTFNGQGSPINVPAGKSLKDINMSMTPAGNLSGHIRDSAGAPAAGVPVQLLRATYNALGQKNFQTVTTDRTDDRGEYRLYWLSPGRYYLSAGTSPGPTNRPAALGGGGNSPNAVPGESFTYTFYPGATNITQAIGIDVAVAAEIGGMDFTVSRQQQLNVRGKVVDSRTGAAPAAVSLSLSYQTFDGGGSFGGANNYNASMGTFELTNINPGNYTITATLQDNTATDAASRARLAAASVPVDVFNNDVENIVLNLVPGYPISGQIRVDGKPLPSVTAVRLQMRPSQNGMITNNLGISTPSIPSPDDAGSFRVEGARPGEYRINVANLPSDYYLKDVRLNQIESLNQPMQFAGSDNAVLDVVVSSGAVQIDGSVFDQKSMPEAGVTVVLIPDQHRDRTELFKNATTDPNGKYTIRSVPPGDYKLFAWDSLDPFAWFDPEILRRDESKGKAIHVSELSNQNVDLKVIAPQ